MLEKLDLSHKVPKGEYKKAKDTLGLRLKVLDTVIAAIEQCLEGN